jgi:ribosomal protein L31
MKLTIHIDIHDDVVFECDSDEEYESVITLIRARLNMMKYDLEGQKAQIKLERTLEQDADRGF